MFVDSRFCEGCATVERTADAIRESKVKNPVAYHIFLTPTPPRNRDDEYEFDDEDETP